MAPMSRMDAQVMSGEVPRGLLEFSTGLNDAFFSLAQRTLRSMLGDGDLLTHLPALDPSTFSRRLLFADPINRFGVWVLGWPPGCQTRYTTITAPVLMASTAGASKRSSIQSICKAARRWSQVDRCGALVTSAGRRVASIWCTKC